MLQEEIRNMVAQALIDLGISEVPVAIDYPADARHGDYTTNVALIAAKKAGKNPMALAEEIGEELRSPTRGLASSKRRKNQELRVFEKIEIARPGFINFWITQEKLIKTIDSLRDNKVLFDAVKSDLTGKKVIVEFAHPNTHKAFHIGHLRNITTGESIVRLLESSGVKVIRANYQGDVGMHIAKCLYGIMHDLEFKVQDSQLSIKEKVTLLGKAYAAGSKAYEEDDIAKKEIGEINKKIYAKDASILQLYQTTRQWSLEYFEEIYKRVYTHFDNYYFESEVFDAGKEIVRRGLAEGVFAESDGAIIFPGSKPEYKLHDRVFITSEGNPTYEGKEMGLGPLQFKENPDLIIHVVGPEQAGYFQVVFEALAQLSPETRGKERHLAYGWVKLKHGKMSSRTGNVVLGEWLLDEAKKKILESYEVSDAVAEQISVGAVKYSFLKVGLSQEIAFDLEESISLQGNSGPYLQYTYARTQSVLRKSETQDLKSEIPATYVLQPEERDVLRLLAKFPEIVSEAATRFAPHLLCTYLFDLAQNFNLFYQKLHILKEADETRAFRLSLTAATGTVLLHGLALLGIDAPERM